MSARPFSGARARFGSSVRRSRLRALARGTRGLDFPTTRACGSGRRGTWRVSGRSVWERFDVIAAAPYERVLGSREMPGAEWFPGARLNYAEHVLGGGRCGAVALRHASESQPLRW